MRFSFRFHAMLAKIVLCCLLLSHSGLGFYIIQATLPDPMDNFVYAAPNLYNDVDDLSNIGVYDVNDIEDMPEPEEPEPARFVLAKRSAIRLADRVSQNIRPDDIDGMDYVRSIKPTRFSQRLPTLYYQRRAIPIAILLSEP
ncbi:hypothetical protein QR680_006536 [Steinernema hermaphroditum]|uniref:Uncharacterized protein n=1 Tax=Steinernema hermaphroditum TaxID=289476 RepID=A0AA39HY58_9BILA|nr:hypothetical protein QR680_006536 [Steinernema hermaphroditum]